MTSFYDRHIMPRLIRCACGAKAIQKRRESIVPLASSRVLELGCGGGLNFGHYDPARVESVAGMDPSAELRAMAERAAEKTPVSISVQEGVAEAAPFDDASFDTVLLTFTLCSVQHPDAVLAEARRVLRPGGRLLFCEHGLAPDEGVQKWQHRVEPVWKKMAGGCHLTRAPGATIAAAGFTIQDPRQGYMKGAPKIAGWVESGVAFAT